MDFSKNSTATAAGFNIGSVLGRTFSVLSKNLGVILGLALAAALPALLIKILAPVTASGELIMGVSAIVDLLLNLAVQGAVTYVVYQALMGRSASFSESVSVSMGRLAALLGVALIVGIGVALGMMLLIIPGIILYCMWAVAIPACVVERLGPIAAMKRSADLTKGHRLSIFCLFLLAGVVGLGLILVVSLLLGLILGSSGAEGSVFGMLLITLIVLLPQAFANVMASVLYYDLRTVKEGLNLVSLAKVFD